MASLTTDELDLLEQNQTARSYSTEELDALEQGSPFGDNTDALISATERTPDEIKADSGQIYDFSLETQTPLRESEQVYYGLNHLDNPEKPSGAGRFIKQLYNSTVANTINAIRTKSEFGKLGTDLAHLGLLKEEFRGRVAAGLPVTVRDIDEYTKPFKKGSFGSIFGVDRPDWAIKIREDYEAGKLALKPLEKPTAESLKKSREMYQLAEAKHFQANDISAYVPEPEGVKDKVIDAGAGIFGFVAQIALLRRLSPTMPEFLVWEMVNVANGGKPGGGAAMQLTLGGIGKAIPGSGILPAVGRGTAGSIFFGTTTYLGGGDTVDILINMGIPFAFEGMGFTKQRWAEYKNKTAFIQSIKYKAPALKNRPNIEIEKAVSDLLTNVETPAARGLRAKETLQKEFKPTETKKVDLSEEVKRYTQGKRYDELLEQAGEGNKKAIKQLNDFVQGKNIPTYEQLLERGYNGDVKAFERIQEGYYQGGPGAKPELEIPKKKKAVKAKAVSKPLTPIEQLKARTEIIKNDLRPPEKIDASNLKKARERGFITSIKEVLPKLKIQGQYVPRSTDVLAIKARNLITDNLSKAEKVALKGNSDVSVAVASELIKYYGEQAAKAKTKVEADALYERAAVIGNDTARKLTESGRTVQAASILGRLTPEGQVRFAAREIQKFNERVETKRGGLGGLRKKIPELTAKQAEHILKEMREIANMPDGKAKVIRFNKLQTHVAELVPTPLYDKIITIWKAGLLSGIKTHGLNLFANLFHVGTETIKDIPATVVDKTASIFTGKRTVTPTVKGIKGGGIEGFNKGIEYIKTGYSERDIGVKLDYKKTNMGKGNLAKGLQAYTETVFRLMGAGDQPFYYATKLMSMFEQAKVAAINQGLKGAKAQKFIDNLVRNPTEKMVKNATKDAEAAVFINNTKLGDVARGIQKLPLGEVVLPFARTPSAVAMQIINYSPVGIAKTVIENIGKGRFDQRAFSQGLGRGISGTAVLVIGAALYDKGLITLDRPANEKERKLQELEGRQANTVFIDGKWRTVQAFGPVGNLLIIGGHFKRAFEETGSPTEAMSEAYFGTQKSFLEQTFMRGVNQFVGALADPERSASFVVGNTISSIIPTIISDVARATDVKDRRAETVPEKILARIPGARQTLEPRITVLGEEKKPTANPLELMLDPTRPSKEISSPVITELRRLFDEGWEVSPSLLGTRTGFEILSQQENTELWKRAGSITKDALDIVITNPLYNDLPDEARADAISEIIAVSQTAAKTEMVVKKITGLEGKELSDMIFELRKSGLATQDIIPVALSKRNPRKAK
jgi:hypothetical protein